MLLYSISPYLSELVNTDMREQWNMSTNLCCHVSEGEYIFLPSFLRNMFQFDCKSTVEGLDMMMKLLLLISDVSSHGL